MSRVYTHPTAVNCMDFTTKWLLNVVEEDDNVYAHGAHSRSTKMSIWHDM